MFEIEINPQMCIIQVLLFILPFCKDSPFHPFPSAEVTQVLLD